MRELSVPSVLILLATIRCSLRVFGLSRTVEAARSIVRRLPAPTTRQTALDAHELAGRVARIGSLFPGRARCLEQSLALWFILGYRRVQAELVVGIRVSPFSSHAWTSVRGHPVNEHPSVVREMTPVRLFEL